MTSSQGDFTMAEEIRETLIEMIRNIPSHLLPRAGERLRMVLEELMEEWEWEKFYQDHREDFRKLLAQAKQELQQGKVSELLEDL